MSAHKLAELVRFDEAPELAEVSRVPAHETFQAADLKRPTRLQVYRCITRRIPRLLDALDRDDG